MSLAVGLILLPLLAARPAQATDSKFDDLSRQIRDLQIKIERLDARLQSAQAARSAGVPPAGATRHEWVDGAESWIAGWNRARKQFFLGSTDGNFYLHPGIIFQLRGVATDRDRNKKNRADDVETGFEIRRAKFFFEGNFLSKDLTYRFQWQDATRGGTPSLQFATVQYRLLRQLSGISGGELSIGGGQFRNPVFKEEIVGDTSQLLVERSLANRFVGGVPMGPELKGIELLLLGQDNPLHAELTLHGGAGSLNTDFTQGHGAPGAVPIDFGIAARIDYKCFGEWIDDVDLTGRNSCKRDLLDLGLGADFTQASGSNAVRWTADAQYMMTRRVSLLAAIMADHSFLSGDAGPHQRTDCGCMIEGGYDLSRPWQLVARYSAVRIDDAFKVAGEGTFQEIAFGLNYFLGNDGCFGNRAKITGELDWLPNGAPPGATGLEYLASPGGQSELALRSQFQLTF